MNDEEKSKLITPLLAWSVGLLAAAVLFWTVAALVALYVLGPLGPVILVGGVFLERVTLTLRRRAKAMHRRANTYHNDVYGRDLDGWGE